MDDFLSRATCERCGADLRNGHSRTTSRFNLDTLCASCDRDEAQAPGYAAAVAAEEQACRAGNYNFKGIGLAGADRAFLADRRKARG